MGDQDERLLAAAKELIRCANEPERVREAEHRFVELVTFSSVESIVGTLNRIIADHFIDFPVWARNLAFRLAVLQMPDDAALLRRAAADLRCFGPDWDAEADRMIRQAEVVEGRP